MKRIALLAVFAVAFAIGGCSSDRSDLYKVKWCEKTGAQIDYRFSNGTRVDCFTKDSFILEFELARNWKQGLLKAEADIKTTGMKANLFLIVEEPDDMDFALEGMKAGIEKGIGVLYFEGGLENMFQYLRQKD